MNNLFHIFQHHEIYEVPWDPTIFCVSSEGSYGVCSVIKGQTICVSCRPSEHCSHTKILRHAIEDETISDIPSSLLHLLKTSDMITRNESPVLRPVSYIPINYHFTEAMSSKLKQSTLERLQGRNSDEAYPILAPDSSDQCHLCGSDWDSESVKTSDHPIPVIDKKNTYYAMGKLLFC